MNKPATKRNIYEEVTKRIVMSLASGDIPWRKPWVSPISKDIINYLSRQPYKGINRLLLPKVGEWMTYNQAKKEGGNIKAGSKGQKILVYSEYIPKNKQDEYERLTALGQPTEHLKQVFAKQAVVFHIDDTIGIKTKYNVPEFHKASVPTDIADWVINQYTGMHNFIINESECDNCLVNGKTITIPTRKQFSTEESWYAVLFAQLIKTTCEKCGREVLENVKAQAREELVAEIGSSMIMNVLRMEHKETENNTLAKCAEWAQMLEKDYRLIVYACSQAEKAAKMVLESYLGKEYD